MTEIKRVNSVAELEALEKSGDLIGLFDVPNEIYHAGPGISSTGLKEILKSPAHFKSAIEKKSDALVNGNLIHQAILEPGLFADTVIVAPACDRRTTEGKRIWAEFQAASEGKTVVDQETHTTICQMRDAVRANRMASKLLSGDRTEVSVYWRDEVTGVLCKARADHINGDLVIDLKSTGDASSRAFQVQIERYKYHLSAAYYLDGFANFLPVRMFAWLAAEKTPPYGCRFYAADSTLLHAGRLEYRKALDLYAECLKKDRWPAYDMKFETISLSPAYEG